VKLKLTHVTWIRICSISDFYGFAPTGTEWDLALKAVQRTEGYEEDWFWWNSGSVLVRHFTSEETRRFREALLNAQNDRSNLSEILKSSTKPSLQVAGLHRLEFSDWDALQEICELASGGAISWQRDGKGMIEISNTDPPLMDLDTG